MIQCTCLVQAGQTPAQHEDALKRVLNSFSQEAFGLEAAFNWITVPAGNGYTAYKPSTSSIVSMTAAEPLAQEKRASLLTDLCEIWMDNTGCSIDEIVAVINDPKDQ